MFSFLSQISLNSSVEKRDERKNIYFSVEYFPFQASTPGSEHFPELYIFSIISKNSNIVFLFADREVADGKGGITILSGLAWTGEL